MKPATAPLAPLVQTPSRLLQAPDHRALLVKNLGSPLPLAWLQPHLPTKNWAHLPLDAIAHSILFLLGPDRLAPLPVTCQHLLPESSSVPPETRTYVVFVTGRGGAGFHSPGPALTRGRGGYFSGNPRPAPARGPPALIPWTGPRLLPPIFNGDPSGVWVGGGLSGDRGRECRKRHPAPGR